MNRRLRCVPRSGKPRFARACAAVAISACDGRHVQHRFAFVAATFALIGACHRDRAQVNELAAKTAQLATKAPGMQVIVERDGRVVVDGNYGFADLEHRVPVTRDTVFCIGSISKQFGAAAIMQLVEAGTLSLEDTLARFLPAFPRADKITVRNLLQHTTGIVDFEYSGTWPTTMGLERTTDEVIATFADLPPLFEPGQRWSYSSSNYVLLAKILEIKTGEPLDVLMKKRVFDRAGLQHTRFCESYEMIPNRARGYVPAKSESAPAWKPAPWAHLGQFALAGGICSTAHDLLRWQHALEEGKVVSAASYRAMSTPGATADGTPFHYGYGLSELRLGNHRRIMHSGGVPGFAAMLEHFPEDKLRIITLANARLDISHEIAIDLLKIPPVRAVPVTAAQLATYAVTVSDVIIGSATFSVDGDRLVLSAMGDRIPLVHIGDGVFGTTNHELRVRFEVTNGKVTRVLFAADDAILSLTPSAAPPSSLAPAETPPAPANVGSGESDVPASPNAGSGESDVPASPNAGSGESDVPASPNAGSGESDVPASPNAGSGG
jgi:CubicO group peptidase (beta-lactamase class C family)